jgi:quercetin dioxygenase-like cupin family protein
MISWTTRIAFALVLLAPAVRADNATTAQPSFVTAKNLKFGDAPPVLPKGARIAVLHGDPTKPGPYTARLKAPSGYKIPAHWHTQDEQLTVVQGTLMLRMGESMQSEPHALAAGDFHFLPGGMRHSAEAKGETIVQITGWGPFDIHYVNPADNPVQRSAKR